VKHMEDKVSGQRRQRIEEKIAQLREEQEIEAVEEIIAFDKTPSQLKADMDRFVIGQEKGKKIMATAIAFHYRRIGDALKKRNIKNNGDIDDILRNTRTPRPIY